MPISVGFYKKIYQWLIDSNEQVKFRPFITKANPYKARVFLVGAHALPKFHIAQADEKLFAEALVDREILQELYIEQLQTVPREFQGSLFFERWLERHGETLLYTSMNTYQVDSAEELKTIDLDDYARGQQVFAEVLEEFQPEILILQGTTAYNQFKKQFAENLIVYHPTITKVQLLEESGPFAEMHFADGKKMLVFVTRSMSYFGQDGAKFEKFKENILNVL